jgi:hypothetical protein
MHGAASGRAPLCSSPATTGTTRRSRKPRPNRFHPGIVAHTQGRADRRSQPPTGRTRDARR